jgi:hypothetical protein
MPPSEDRLLSRIKESDFVTIVQLGLQYPRVNAL